MIDARPARVFGNREGDHAQGSREGAFYYYRVRATNAVGESEYVSGAGAALLATPTAPQATATSGSEVQVQWTDNSPEEDGYSIQQLIDGEWEEVAWTDADATSQTVAGTYEPTTDYSFRVQAWSDWSVSLASATATLTTPAWPAAPTGLTATVISGTEIDLSWTGSTGADSYSIEDQVDYSGEWTLIDTVPASQTTFAATGLTPGGTPYAFRVAATNGVGASAYCVLAATATENQSPVIVVGPTAGQAPVSWSSDSLQPT